MNVTNRARTELCVCVCVCVCVLQYVDELLRVLGTDGTQTVPTPPWHYEMTPPASDDKTSTNTHTAGPLTLRDALSFCYDLKYV